MAMTVLGHSLILKFLTACSLTIDQFHGPFGDLNDQLPTPLVRVDRPHRLMVPIREERQIASGEEKHG